MAALLPEIVCKLQSTILQSGNCSKLNEAVVTLHEKLNPETLDKLMSSSTLTDRPSVYLNELIALSTKIGVSSDIIRLKFIQENLINIKPVLAAATDL